MADNVNDKEKPNNEEIINELTNNLESQCLKSEPSSESIEEKVFAAGDNSDSEEPESKPEKINPFDDYIDENAMKHTEESLNDDEKLKRKDESDCMKKRGNDFFKNCEYMESINVYTEALRLCPLSYTNERSVLYSNRSASKIQLDYKESALEDCTKALELNPDYCRALNRRAKLYEGMDKLDESLEDYKKLQALDESNVEVRNAIYSLSAKIDKRNEEMKAEMLGKLKDLGNMILKPFGLSTDNFQLNKDPNSGGYSVNFNQNK